MLYWGNCYWYSDKNDTDGNDDDIDDSISGGGGDSEMMNIEKRR